mmetsp:Transcript_21405/g.34873  ORF Transcript_21405/g.34873 Transcript_21405/m.34873 type:complete len:171 (+) Transcript_21405:358-870(+)
MCDIPANGMTATRLLDTFNRNLEGTGNHVEIRRCNRETGELFETDNQSEVLSEADYKMRTAQIARMISVLNTKEKLEWAVARKEEGNSFYKMKNFKDATQRYLDALVGLDFGTTELEKENATNLVQLPVLTNLAACYAETKQWKKVVLFCDQAIQINDESVRAHLRKAKA